MTPLGAFPLAVRVPVGNHWDNLQSTDLFAPAGTPWLAVFDGTASAWKTAMSGNALFLTSTDGSTTAFYAHGRVPGVTGPVSAGQWIGEVGTTGNAAGTAPHLHWAITQGTTTFGPGGDGNLDPRAALASAGTDTPMGPAPAPIGPLTPATDTTATSTDGTDAGVPGWAVPLGLAFAGLVGLAWMGMERNPVLERRTSAGTPTFGRERRD